MIKPNASIVRTRYAGESGRLAVGAIQALTNIRDDGESCRYGHSGIDNRWVFLILDGCILVGPNVPMARQARN